MLVMAPLMHGNAQWVMWNAFMMGGTAVLFTDHRYDPDRVWRLVSEEKVVSIGLVGDAMARPLTDALAAAAPGTYDTSTLAVVGSGGAMLSAPVKAELHAQLPSVIIMDRFGSSESGAQGAVDDDATGPRFVMSDDTSVLDDDRTRSLPVTERSAVWPAPDEFRSVTTRTRKRRRPPFPSMTGVCAGRSPVIWRRSSLTGPSRCTAAVRHPSIPEGRRSSPRKSRRRSSHNPMSATPSWWACPTSDSVEQVAVVVSPRRPGHPPSLEDLQAHCRTLIAGYKIPRHLRVVDELPLTAAGKPDTKEARSLF